MMVDHADAFSWLAERSGPVIASIPTASEVGMDPAEWWVGFAPAAVAACLASADGAPVVFVQTDRLADRITYSWPALVARHAPLTWHKIALTRGPSHIDLHRPTYRHILAVNGRPGVRSADVEADGQRLWSNGAGANTARRAASWLHEVTAERVLNPFCGHGTFLYALSRLGHPCVGCDLDIEQVAAARAIVSS